MNNLPIQTYESVVQPRDVLEKQLAEVRANAIESLLTESFREEIAGALADFDGMDEKSLQTLIWSGQPPEPDGDVWCVEYMTRAAAIQSKIRDFAAPVLPKQPDVTLTDEGEAAKIVKAAEKLVRCKGRYHSEQNYRALAALFGVTVPDLPPLPSDDVLAQPVITEQAKREQVRREHAEWSDATFGDVGPVGPLKHLSKEALEAAANPEDPLEWADMQFLLWDAQRRMGISDDFITRAMIEKLEINKARQWPEPKDGEPRLHINTQSAQLVSEPYKLPQGYALVPCKLTAENGAKSCMIGKFIEQTEISCPECFGDDECETCDGSGTIEVTAHVSWTTIKDIWAKGIEHFAAAPAQESE